MTNPEPKNPTIDLGVDNDDQFTYDHVPDPDQDTELLAHVQEQPDPAHVPDPDQSLSSTPYMLPKFKKPAPRPMSTPLPKTTLTSNTPTFNKSIKKTPGPRSTPRTESDIGKLTVLYDGSALEQYYDNRNSKATLVWVREVTTGLSTKFSAIRAETADSEQLEAVYDLGMRVCELERTVSLRGLSEAFMIYSKHGVDWKLDKTLFECYSTIPMDDVRASVRYVKEYEQEHLVWGTTLSFALMENSCEPELRARVNEELMGIPLMEHGGPTYFKLVIQAISSMSYAVSLSLTIKVTEMKLKDFEGEDVTKAVSFLRGALHRLKMCHQTPPNVHHLLLKVMQSSSNYKFNGFFATWYNTLEQNSILNGVPIEHLVTEEAILTMATRQYLNHSEEGTWIINRRRNASFQNTLPRSGTDSKQRKNSSNNNSTTSTSGNNNETVPPYMIPPEPGQPHERTYKGRPEYWCKPCAQWRRHTTEEHERGDDQTNKRSDNTSTSSANVAIVANPAVTAPTSESKSVSWTDPKKSKSTAVANDATATDAAKATDPTASDGPTAGLVGILRRTGI